MRKVRDRRGLAGWLVIALILACAALVGVLIALSGSDKSLEFDRAEEYVVSMITVDTGGTVPKVETELVEDYGEHLLVAARYRIEVEGKKTVSGSYALDISDSSQQVYNVSEEFEYDYDFESAAYRFAIDWGMR